MTRSSILGVIVSKVESMSKAVVAIATAINIKPLAEVILGILGIVVALITIAELMFRT